MGSNPASFNFEGMSNPLPPKALYIHIALALLTLYACKDKEVETYENDLGIDPATIAQIDSANYTTIDWLDSTQDFGPVKEGDTVFIKFRFKNTGAAALFISRVEPSCGCTGAEYPHAPILPGDSGIITGILATRYHPGYMHKTIQVTTNTLHGISKQLSFHGQVIADSTSLQVSH